MSFFITCPNCGPRSVHEFRFGSEEKENVNWDERIDRTRRYEIVHHRINIAGSQKELWFHRDGCETWVSILRDTVRDIEIAEAGEKM